MDKEHKQILTKLIRNSSEHIHLWRFIAGVVYSLEQYDSLTDGSQKKRSNKDYQDETLRLLDSIDLCKQLPAEWLRGYYYNAGIMRLDAAWERSLRVIFPVEKGNGPALYRKLVKERKLPSNRKSIFYSIRQEVNRLKHYAQRAPDGIRE